MTNRIGPLGVLVGLIYAGPTGAIVLHLVPQVAFAPAAIHLEIHVTPEPSDRVIEVSASDEDGFLVRVSGFLPSPNQRLYIVEWTALSAGRYEVTAIIRGRLYIRSVRTALLILDS